MTLGQTIHRLRLEHGLSQADLADRLEVSRQSISKSETDASVPELDKLIALSKIFGVTLDELVGHAPDGSASPAPETASGSTPDPAKPASGTLPLRKLVGILLLCFCGLMAVLNILLFSLFEPVLAVCGVLCLTCRRPGLWCGWAWVIRGAAFLFSAMGIQWQAIFQTFSVLSDPEHTNLFPLAFAWGETLLVLLLFVLTVRRFRQGTFRFTRRTVPALAAGWALFLALPFLTDQISLALPHRIQGEPFGRMYLYLRLLLVTALDFGRLALLAVLLVCLVRGIRTHRLRKKTGLP